VDTKAFTGMIGLPMPNTELALLDDDGREVPPGQAGEIADRKSTRLNSSHNSESRMPSSA
jgi:acyl-coenzyme A synthetase/AMP-(fatty) acid ligase